MNRFWSFFTRRRGPVPSPSTASPPSSGLPASPPHGSGGGDASSSAAGGGAATPPEGVHGVAQTREDPGGRSGGDEESGWVCLHADDLEMAPVLTAALRSAVESGARGVLIDPEEFDCIIYVISDGTLTIAGTCSLEDYESSRRTLQMLEGRLLREGERTFMCQLSHMLTDLGQRTIVGYLPFQGTDSILAEFRKGNVRLVNRLRPGTSLTRHNREQVLRMLARAGERPAPSFVERLVRDGLLASEVAEAAEGEDPLERIVRNEPLARKAVARVLGEYLGVGWVDVEENLPPREVAQLLTKEEVLEWEALPSEDLGERLVVAMVDPFDPEGVARVQARLGRPVDVRLAAGTDIRVAAEKLFRYR